MKNQAFYITGVTVEEYLAWCKENNKVAYRYATKQEFFYKIRTFRICRDNESGKLINKRIKK